MTEEQAIKELCPFCYMGRVTLDGEKPYQLKGEFKDCHHCRGTGLLVKEKKDGPEDKGD